MASRQNKIGLIIAGGTLYYDHTGVWRSVARHQDVSSWLKGLPELSIVADIEPIFVCGERQSTLTSEHWQLLAKTIQQNYNHFYGFVVLLSVDSFVYTAAALRLALTNLDKPIVITGSPMVKPPTVKRGPRSRLQAFKNIGIRANLLNAIHVARGDVAEVVAVYGNRVLNAGTLKRGETGSANTIMAYDRPLGHIDFGINLADSVTKRAPRKLHSRLKFNPDVHVIEYTPGNTERWLSTKLNTLTGLIVLVDAVEDISPTFRNALLAAKRQGLTPIFYTRNIRSSDDRQFIIVNDMSLEMTLVKLMWSLAAVRSYQAIAKLMKQNIAGEKLNRNML